MTAILAGEQHEEARHRAAIQSLVMETGFPESGITMLYEQELSRLRQQARIEDFLLVLTIRRVKENLHLRAVRG